MLPSLHTAVEEEPAGSPRLDLSTSTSDTADLMAAGDFPTGSGTRQ